MCFHNNYLLPNSLELKQKNSKNSTNFNGYFLINHYKKV
ncbi:hypothetical protein appser12_4980 [Actinobacillus pleuropneumoniae serovar 12 str. 1096]|uniref:Uncharacterized protein n=1 Tax=Actinobacillus pleuropneumoniae serovar 6 str. Femo TaxID=754256 RepID=A0A828Q2C9_ACTPL|nr:hypothetical protein appser6_5230 [Actinobacillus pleuropneumoniae serovar 6 str. Femo]EFM94735.1 hypothetical protein appser9_4840 [Actinobacillus pleuropneumoniae serovar 9 str. CVJ13261]EFM96813.1 hypothetical protein appser10_5060 [Actinobacillus pleuropneumoniae serovar 10 str. D13039]EFN01161.1 hypothetical protein appser12_4980 [Actinobacillus pleuropneumoniae serovar 12 str. 1096]EFN03198.1 hypothetical protein appser13_5350 [Actinobacillus pleuropneumoniae serovar 13 str. N273]